MAAQMKNRFKAVSQLPLDSITSFPFATTPTLQVKNTLSENHPQNNTLADGITETLFQFTDNPQNEATPWSYLDETLQNLTEKKFAFFRGEFLNPEKSSYQALVRFSAKGQLPDGHQATFQSFQEIVWKLHGETVPSLANNYLIDPSEWKITDWTLISSRLLTAETPLFRDVTDNIITSPRARDAINNPVHEQHLENLFSGKEISLRSDQGQFFTTDATGQHPGLSVVDIDNDGRDDLYVCVRFGRNLLFRNRGDNTFEEVAADYGLDLEGLSTSAIFADFDNDGDQDVIIGRSLDRSIYLRNIKGYFVDSTETHIAGSLPFLTTSLAAADYNRDGLLDIYFSTYGFAQRQQRTQVARAFLSEYPEDLIAKKFLNPSNIQQFLNLPGPPNVLLVNTGNGRFEISPHNEQVETWHETLQATWSDFDQDGFPDLYVCNDFAPDQLYRNEEGQGFRDVTDTIGHNRMRGFGMGASFGDFDNDLDLDLYVSNMFSKAGLRIIDQVPFKDERFRWSAEGNLLFKNKNGASFDFVTQHDSPFAQVAQADWSWGGQFCDFDNDGFLDLYVPNGYFTAPPRFAGEVDL